MSRAGAASAVTLDQPERRPRVSGVVSGFASRVHAGDIGSLPIVVGLIVIWGVLEGLNPSFLSSRNLANLATECVPVGIIAIGIVLVLLVAEIDLSVGSMSGVASSILGVGLTSQHWPLPVVMVVALAAGAAVGIIYGAVFVRFGVPSFVITLAGLLALLGLQLQLLGANGTINIPFTSAIVGFMQRAFVPAAAAYALAALCAAAYLGSALARAYRRRKAHLPPMSVRASLVKAALLAVGLEAACWYLSRAEGVSLPFVLFAALVVVCDFALRRTRWGRAVYAVGGSAEAARRAGIKVTRTYVSVFLLCSLLAALGGLLSAGYLAASSTASGTGDVNLDAIAAAVIGGTSLFGGRGNAYSAFLGIVVLESIANGLTLLNMTSAVRFMVTGGVLAIAVIVDSLARRRRVAHGRA